MRTFRIPLRVVFYHEHDVWFAHCLEMDLVGDGASAKDALQQLREAISIQVHTSLEHHNMANLFQPADAKYFEMFAAGKDIAVGEVALKPIDAEGIHIDGIDAREYERADQDDLACV